MLQFKQIPGTGLEIASEGASQNRIMVIRGTGEVEPMDIANDCRIILIGTPHARIRNGMASGAISRPKLAEIGEPISGSTYQKLRVYLDQFVK